MLTITGNPTKSYIDTQIAASVAALVASAPAALDTLNELSLALGNDASFATTMTNALALKLAKASNLSDLANAATARANLGLPSIAASFPGSPATGDRCYRTDRSIEYYYDGTRWLSTTPFFLPIGNTDFLLPRTATTGAMSRVVNPWAGLYDIYALDGVFHTFVTATSTWSLIIVKNDGVSGTTIATRSTSGDTANSHLSNRVAINAVVSNTVDNLQAEITLSSGSASLYATFGMTYRLIG